MSTHFKVAFGLLALAVVAACAPRPEPIVFEPAPPIHQHGGFGGKMAK